MPTLITPVSPAHLLSRKVYHVGQFWMEITPESGSILDGHQHTARREPSSLHLNYAPEAAQEVRDLVRQEQVCCPFLQFDVRENERGVSITITTPKEAQEAADTLFALFAPASAGDSTPVFAKSKEPIQP